MSVAVAVALLVGVTGLIVALTAAIRSRTTGSREASLADSSHSVFFALLAVYGIVIAFVLGVSLQKYSAAKQQASEEANAVVSLDRRAQFFNDKDRRALSRQLVCYAQEVITDEWPAMKSGHSSPVVTARVARLNSVYSEVEPDTDSERAALDESLGLMAQRSDARSGRILESRTPLPAWLWAFILLGALTAIGLCIYITHENRRIAQAILIGVLALFFTWALLAILALSRPFSSELVSIKPQAMVSALADVELHARDGGLRHAPCEDD